MYKNLARFALLATGILSLIFFYASSQLRFDYNFENFFPTGDEDLEFFLGYREAFENDNDYLLVGIRNREGIFKEDFLTKIDAVTNRLDSLTLTGEVLSVTNLKNPVIGPLGILQPLVLNIHSPSTYHQDSIRIYRNENLTGTLVAKEVPAVAILLKHREMISKRDADLLMEQVNTILGQYAFDEVHVAGKAKAQAVYVQKMQQELLIFVGASMVLVIIFLFIAYRSFWGIWVPLLVVMLAAVWIAGIMSLTGKMLDVMMVLLPTIMFVVGMSDVVHILTKYLEELRNGANKIKALKVTFREIGLATFLTSLTTAVGFLTLLTASVQPIRDFGLYTAAGVFVAFILAFTVLPSILLFMKKPAIAYKEGNRLLWKKPLHKLFILVIRNRFAVLGIAAIVTGISIYGVSQLRINTFLLEDIRDNDPLKKDFVFFDQHFGGSRPFEMAVIVKDSSYNIYSREVLDEIQKLENFLTGTYGANNLLSPLVIVKGINKALNGGIDDYYRLPEGERDYQRVRQIIKRFSNTNLAPPLTADNNQLGRISGKMADIGSQASKIKNEELRTFISNNINPELVEFRLTGTSLLIDKNAQYIITNMMQGLGIAFFVVAAIAGLLFRSLKMILITLIPNLIPLMVIAGIMGLFGIYLKLSTSIIFTIAFGIAVDDTIHFISKLRVEMNKGKSLVYAVRNTFLYTGKAIIITTIMLAGGFLTLIFSSFGGTFYTGLLVSLTLVFAVIADLTLLPVLIILFFSRSSKKQQIREV